MRCESVAPCSIEPYVLHAMITALEHADRFDVIHSHLPYRGFALAGIEGVSERLIHTLHEPVSADLGWLVGHHPEIALAAVSDTQVGTLRTAGAKNCRLVHNGIDLAAFRLRPRSGNGLVFLGAIRPEKGPDIALRVAAETGLQLALAGPKAGSREFFDDEIQPFLNGAVRYLGVVGHAQKLDLLGGAECLLMPSRSEESFGLVALEAMACGTPVVALATGALPEIVEDGVNGYVTAEENELAELVMKARRLDRQQVRASITPRFDIEAVARRYLGLYEEIAAR